MNISFHPRSEESSVPEHLKTFSQTISVGMVSVFMIIAFAMVYTESEPGLLQSMSMWGMRIIMAAFVVGLGYGYMKVSRPSERKSNDTVQAE